MESTIEMTDGLKKLTTIIDEFPSDSSYWNEAQNRFQFIDRLLVECLGWSQQDISVEENDESGGRADYLLAKPLKAVLEAKKEAVLFDLLPGTKPSQTRKLGPLVKGCKNLKAAVNQVIPYCAFHGAQLAIICNGPQLLIFQSNLLSESPLEGKAYIFDGFNEYIQEFTTLWKLLSPEAISENRALRELSNKQNSKLPQKASSVISDLDGYRYRSSFQENLRFLGSILLDEVDDNLTIASEFYKECYVPLEANNRHLLLSKKIIEARYKRAGDNGVEPAKMIAKVSKGRIKLDEVFQPGVNNSKPMVVIGDVGVGKTSFFENLYQELTEKQKKVTLFLNVNLGNKATLSQDVRTFVLIEIPQILKQHYGIDIDKNSFVERVYQDDLEDFEESVSGQLKNINEEKFQLAKISFLQDKLSDRGDHLKNCLAYLNNFDDKQIIMIVDNADQRRFETQQEAFLIAEELAATRKLLVFVALRPSTFYQSKLTGALSGYENRILTISPPPADEVIRKRLLFAVRIAEGKAAPAALSGVELKLTSVVLFLKATLRSIRSNQKIQTFLSNITGGNTRLVIELISSFCGSPNVEAERIVDIEGKTGDYKVPLHEFTKHALLGEYAYYNSLSSLVAFNLFDVSTPNKREHFLSILIIAYISSPMGNKDNDGFVSGDIIMSEMMRLGFIESQVRVKLRGLAAKRLIETPHGHYREVIVEDSLLPETFHFRATTIGLYHIRHWVGDFAYLDAMSIDTPIFDVGASKKVFELAGSHEIRTRYERTNAFKNYITACWNENTFNCDYYDLSNALSLEYETFTQVEKFLSRGGRKN